MTTPPLSLLPNARQQFLDVNNIPLVGGTVETYIPATFVLVDTYQDPAGTIPNSHPIVLDENGTCIIWTDQQVRQIVQDSLGNQVWDNLSDAPSPSGALLAVNNLSDLTNVSQAVTNLGLGPLATADIFGTDTGAANAIAVTLSPAPSTYSAGLFVFIKVAHNNTGATTINLNSLGTKAVTLDGSALTASQLLANVTYLFVYDGTEFALIGAVGGSAGGGGAAGGYAVDGGSTNALTGTISGFGSSYSAGQFVFIKVANNTTGAATLNINAIGATAIHYQGVALTSGMLLANVSYLFLQDGTVWNLLSPPASFGAIQTLNGATLTSPSGGAGSIGAQDLEIRPDGLKRVWCTIRLIDGGSGTPSYNTWTYPTGLGFTGFTKITGLRIDNIAGFSGQGANAVRSTGFFGTTTGTTAAMAIQNSNMTNTLCDYMVEVIGT